MKTFTKKELQKMKNAMESYLKIAENLVIVTQDYHPKLANKVQDSYSKMSNILFMLAEKEN